MTLWVHVYCGYPSYGDIGLDWNNADHEACKFVKALKDIPFGGYADVPKPGGGKVRITQEDRSGAFHVFGTWGAAKLQEIGLKSCALVSVPSASCTEVDGDEKGGALVKAVATRTCGAEPLNALAWKRAMLKSREGGSRSAPFLRSQLCGRQTLPSKPIVLIDDVATTGGHLIACAEWLRARGGAVEHAICAAQTVWDRPSTGIFNIASRDLEGATPLF